MRASEVRDGEGLSILDEIETSREDYNGKGIFCPGAYAAFREIGEGRVVALMSSSCLYEAKEGEDGKI